MGDSFLLAFVDGRHDRFIRYTLSMCLNESPLPHAKVRQMTRVKVTRRLASKEFHLSSSEKRDLPEARVSSEGRGWRQDGGGYLGREAERVQKPGQQ